MTAEPSPAPALDGFRIIDASTGVGGPYAAMLLAEQGADVIKVEPPDGDPFRREPAFHVLNRSKRAVTLDLDDAAGRAALKSLLRGADVFLYDWAPGLDNERGFGDEALRAINPHLVVGHLPAYGTRGPFSNLPPDEALVQALSGLCDAQYRYGPRPVYINMPVAGYAHALVAAISVAATLYARLCSGRGDRFEASAIAATFAVETIAWLRAPGVVRLAGQQDPRGPIPTYRLVQATDDWFFAGALTPPFWANMAVAAGLEDCLIDDRFRGAPMGIPVVADRRELAQRVDAAFAVKSRDEWLDILEDADVPRAPVLSREEWARDPHVVHNNMMIDIDDPVLGATRQMNVPVSLKLSPGRVRGPAPLHGEHNALLRERSGHFAGHGRAADDSVSPRQQKTPIEGITVIDLSGFIAGASASMMLADLGANVIKIEAPGGDGWRSSGLAFLGSNRGKRSVVIDLKHPEGRDLLLELVDRADVVHDNFRAGVMERLGLGWDVIHARNPRVVMSSVTGYGTSGPLAHLPGFDPMMQSRGGVMRAQGEPGGEPVYLQVPVCDYGTAYTAAFGILAALVARERTGVGDRVETSLANSALTMQAGEMLFYDGRPPDPPGARDLAGRNALYRIYGTQGDNYIMLACTTHEHAAAFSVATGIALPGDALSQPTEGPLAETIAAAFAQQPMLDVLDALWQHTVPSAPCTKVEQIFDAPHLAENDLWWDADHPRWGAVRQTGTLIHWQDMKMTMQRRAPTLGEHTRECLLELGVPVARVDALTDAGVVVQG